MLDIAAAKRIWIYKSGRLIRIKDHGMETLWSEVQFHHFTASVSRHTIEGTDFRKCSSQIFMHGGVFVYLVGPKFSVSFRQFDKHRKIRRIINAFGRVQFSAD